MLTVGEFTEWFTVLFMLGMFTLLFTVRVNMVTGKGREKIIKIINDWYDRYRCVCKNSI